MILTAEGEPFKKIGAAALAANSKNITDYKIEPYKNGFAIIEKKETVKEAAKAATTSPWDAHGSKWKPDIFRTPKQHQGFVLHFSTQENVQIRLDEGYVCAKAEDYGCHTDSQSVDGVLRRSGMIGMEISEKEHKARLAYNAYMVATRSGNRKEDLMTNAQKIIDESNGEMSVKVNKESTL